MNLGSQFFGTPSDSLGIITAIFTVEKINNKNKKPSCDNTICQGM